MTAGKGIVHSEMPEQEEGLLAGFQLWVNLPAKDKMSEPAYQEFIAGEIAVETLPDGSVIKVIAGTTDTGTSGPIANSTVNPVYLDVSLNRDGIFEQSLSVGDNAFIYAIDGEVLVGEQRLPLPAKQLGLLNKGDRVVVTAGASGGRFLLVAGTPINESVARAGPFVMNTKDEIL